MNANDLADRLEEFYTGTHIQKAAETLRQQAIEIESLKTQLKSVCNAVMELKR
jgi:biotin operon repressor